MEVRLKVLVGKSAGQSIQITGPRFVIGRAEDCHLRPRSDLISRQHCALILEGDYFAVRDFGSKNGTQVNGIRVEGEQELTSGDKLIVGPLAFEVVLVGGLRPRVKSPTDSGTSEIDIADWLTESQIMAGETRSLPDNETIEVLMETSPTVEVPPGVLEDSKSDEKKGPGKLPAVPKQSAASSEEAASNTLRRLRKLR